MKWIIAILMLSLIMDETLCQRGRNGRRLRNRQRQGRLLAAQGAFGPPPQADILLPNADPIPFNTRQPVQDSAPRQGRQRQFNNNNNNLPVNQLRAGRQFTIAGDDGSIQGRFPDEEGNYNFQFSTDDGSFQQENGGLGNVKDGEVSWTSPEGELISFTYTADEDGYNAAGSHIPQNVPLPDNLAIWADLLQQGRR